jgi:hypothetical protein
MLSGANVIRSITVLGSTVSLQLSSQLNDKKLDYERTLHS